MINALHGYGLFTYQPIIHDQCPVLLIACARDLILHTMLLEVMSDLIPLFLKPLSRCLPIVVLVMSGPSSPATS